MILQHSYLADINQVEKGPTNTGLDSTNPGVSQINNSRTVSNWSNSNGEGGKVQQMEKSEDKFVNKNEEKFGKAETRLESKSGNITQ